MIQPTCERVITQWVDGKVKNLLEMIDESIRFIIDLRCDPRRAIRVAVGQALLM